jgi:hypothetical protein
MRASRKALKCIEIDAGNLPKEPSVIPNDTNASTIFLTQVSPAGWRERIAEGTVGDAILDRILHNSYEIVIEGEDFMRKRKSFKNDTLKKAV